MFLTEEDYVTVADQERSILYNSSKSHSLREKTAIEEVSTYLRGKYDVLAIFAATADARNHLIVTITCDVSLYHLASWLPGKMGLEIRIERYDRAIAQLRDIAKGNITPDLPLLTDDNGQSTGGSISFGGDDANEYDW